MANGSRNPAGVSTSPAPARPPAPRSVGTALDPWAGVAGLLAAALAVGTAELVAGILGSRSPLVAVADAVVELTPGGVVRWAIDTFGDRNRLVLGLSMLTVMAAAAWAIGVAARRRRSTAIAGFSIVAVLGIAAGLADPLTDPAPAVIAPLVGALAGLVALRWFVPRPATAAPTGAPGHEAAASPDAGDDVGGNASDAGGSTDAMAAGSRPETLGSTDPTAPDLPPRSRREFLVGALAVAGGAAAFGFVGRAWQGRAAVDEARLATDLPSPRIVAGPPPAGAQIEVAGISPLVTPNSQFYRIDTAITVPRVEPTTHVVRVTGLVEQPLELSYRDLLDEADTEAYVTLSCVSNEVGGGLVGNALWQGVPLERLLERARVDPTATQIVGRSVDGWTGGFPVEAAFDGRTALVAVGMNGEPLPIEHGYPVRLVISGLYGYVSDTKWLSEIELTTFDAYDAYWIPRGWSRYGPIKTQSRIDVPESGARFGAGEVVVAGVAWSDERGVSAVEVSVDDGPWRPAELAEELASTSWRQWRFTWDATSGEHELAVRATDADGVPQTAEIAPPAPDGATGHHTIRVSVV